jgi:hypothetical protein
MVKAFAHLQILPATAMTTHCSFAVVPSNSSDGEFAMREFGNRTPVHDGADLLRKVQALVPDKQLESVWLCACFKNGLRVIFQRVDERPTFNLQQQHIIANFASIANEYMAECLEGVAVDFQAEFQCTVQYRN